MRSHGVRPSLLRLLLFPEVCLLAGVAGVLAMRHPWPGLVLLAVLWWLDRPRSASPGRALCLALAFVLALLYAHWRVPAAPHVPDWLAAASAIRENNRGERVAPKPLRIRVRVDSAVPLPSGRVRLLLADARPAPPDTPPFPADARPDLAHRDTNSATAGLASATAGEPEPYQGKIVWNWYRAETLPLPGQWADVTLRLLPQRGLRNPGVWDIDQYWADQGVFFRASGGRNVAFLPLAGPDAPGGAPGGAPGAGAGPENVPAGRPGDAPPPASGDAPPPAPDAEATRPDRSWATASAELRESLRRRYLACLPQEPVPGQPGATRPTRAAAVLPALIFGDRAWMDEELRDLFSRSTLAHSLSLSGLHLGFTLLAAYLLAFCLGRMAPGIWLRIPRTRLVLILALPLAVGYLWLGQMPIALLRAFCMLLFWTLLALLQRPRVLLDGVLAALGALLLLNPLSLFDISLQLSILSMTVLGLCLPPLSRLTERLIPAGRCKGLIGRALRSGLMLFGTSLAIQIVLLPLTVRTFGASGLAFPLNMIWLPVQGLLVMPAAFLGLPAAALGWELPARGLLFLASLPCEALLRLLAWLHAQGLLPAPLLPRPHWLSSGGYWLLCLALPALWAAWQRTRRSGISTPPAPNRQQASKGAGLPRQLEAGADPSGRQQHTDANSAGGQKETDGPGWRREAGAVVLGLFLFLAPPLAAWHASTRTGVRLCLLDVGQGQSVLVEWSGLGDERASGRILVDGGGSLLGSFDVGRSIVSPALTDNALPRLTAVFNSHPDADHLAGLLFVLEEFRIGAYYGNGDSATPGLAAREEAALQRRGLAKTALAAGERLELGPGLHLEVLWPPASARPALASARSGQEKGNNASLVLRLVWQGRPLALLCGDAEIPALRGLLERNTALEAQVLVLPHHGSANSLDPALYARVRPRLALAACGYANRFAFPAASVRAALRDAGIPLYSTASAGQLNLGWTRPDGPPTLKTTPPGLPPDPAPARQAQGTNKGKQ